MHDYSLHPYIYSSGGSRKKEIPENEGQHLQTVFPPFNFRLKLKLGYDFGKYAYITDFCQPKDKGAAYNEIGQVLHSQWSKYWNNSSTFLLQKTPSLDIQFLELTKVMPTLHVLVIRHPMTSNSWGNKWMGLGWLDAWSHTLEVLASGEIEWYAVVTYEALIQYHDVVVEELMEVVRSGMRRSGGDFGSDADGRRVLSILSRDPPEPKTNHRQLELHASQSSLRYLQPKSRSITLWKACNVFKSCHTFLKQLSSDILPLFGYVDVTVKSGANKNELTTDPGPKVVSREFGHILFSSEGEALKRLRENRHAKNEGDSRHNFVALGDHPSSKLISTMKELLTSEISPLRGRKLPQRP